MDHQKDFLSNRDNLAMKFSGHMTHESMYRNKQQDQYYSQRPYRIHKARWKGAPGSKQYHHTIKGT